MCGIATNSILYQYFLVIRELRGCVHKVDKFFNCPWLHIEFRKVNCRHVDWRDRFKTSSNHGEVNTMSKRFDGRNEVEHLARKLKGTPESFTPRIINVGMQVKLHKLAIDIILDVHIGKLQLKLSVSIQGLLATVADPLVF